MKIYIWSSGGRGSFVPKGNSEHIFLACCKKTHVVKRNGTDWKSTAQRISTYDPVRRQ
jgi:hypothetical protein